MEMTTASLTRLLERFGAPTAICFFVLWLLYWKVGALESVLSAHVADQRTSLRFQLVMCKLVANLQDDVQARDAGRAACDAVMEGH